MLMVVAATLEDRQGRILVQQRPQGTQMAGLWEFPGGKMEAGETPEAALVRELDEELGIQVDEADLEPFHFASAPLEARHLLLLLYRCTRWAGEPVAHQATALQWLKPEELVGLPMPPADIPFIDALIRYSAARTAGVQPIK